MVFNVEPAIYIDGYGGLRHCDVVAITENGVEVLTPFQLDPEQLIFDHPREAAIGMPMDGNEVEHHKRPCFSSQVLGPLIVFGPLVCWIVGALEGAAVVGGQGEEHPRDDRRGTNRRPSRGIGNLTCCHDNEPR